MSDGTNTANGTVTIQLVGIEANSTSFAVLQNTAATLPALDGRIVDVESKAVFTFSSPTLPSGDGTVQFTDPVRGIITYTPPNSTYSGTFPVQYKVTDGTYSTIGVVSLSVAPLITTPLLIPVALQTQPTNVPSLVASGNVQDIASTPSYTFTATTVPFGDGSVQITARQRGR